jgi:hypothetical protein
MLLDLIKDVAFMERHAEQSRERNRIIDRIAFQMCCSRQDAAMMYALYEATDSSENQTVH